MNTVLVAGSTGMLGGLVARHLLDQEEVQVRLLVRNPSQHDRAKRAALDELESLGAVLVPGDVADPPSLETPLADVDVVVSALQGGPTVIVDGQIALAEAAVRHGARRFIPSDFALDLFAAPEGAPQFAMRRQADATIDAMPLQVVHVLNGAFMDMMLDPQTAGIVDLHTSTARLWGTGDEPFNLTTVDDTARFTAKLATDPEDVSGLRRVSGAETTFNTIIAKTETLTGRSVTTQVLGSIDDLRRITATAQDPWSVLMEWYFLSMITVPPFSTTDTHRYPDLQLTTLDDYLTAAHRALQS